MKLEVYKYIGKYGLGLIFITPGLTADVIIRSPESWELQGEFEVEKRLLEKCADENEPGIWSIDYIE